jgi:DNA-binding MarR family transcriptional regulator
MKKKRAGPRDNAVEHGEALALHACIAALLREFKLEPGMLAGSVYAGLHANDVGLLQILADPADWNVRRVAQELSAPISTISSALDRLEKQSLVERKRIPDDRRVVRIVLTERGRRLASRLQSSHIENCRTMLSRLGAKERAEFIRLAVQLTSK